MINGVRLSQKQQPYKIYLCQLQHMWNGPIGWIYLSYTDNKEGLMCEKCSDQGQKLYWKGWERILFLLGWDAFISDKFLIIPMLLVWEP